MSKPCFVMTAVARYRYRNIDGWYRAINDKIFVRYQDALATQDEWRDGIIKDRSGSDLAMPIDPSTLKISIRQHKLSAEGDAAFEFVKQTVERVVAERKRLYGV